MDYLNEAEMNAVLAHFPDISEQAIEYATNEVLSESKYIFIKKGPKCGGLRYKGHCTHCHSNFYVDGDIKQNAQAICPKCESVCIYKKSWIGRKHLIDLGSFLWFDKSPIDPGVITASLIYCKRDYSGDYEKVKTECRRTTIYTFKIGEAAMYKYAGWKQTLERRKSIYNDCDMYDMKFAIKSLVEAACGTPYQYSGYAAYSFSDILKYLGLFSERPNVEVLTKCGHRKVIEKYMKKDTVYRAIDWNARKVHEFFKISKQDYKMMAESDATGPYVMYAPDFVFGLSMWQKARKEKSKLSYKELITACNTFYIYNYFDRFKKICKYSTLHRVINYMKKQYEADSKHYTMPSQVIVSWSDYINECIHLAYDLSNEAILFPKNLRKAHERTSKLIKIQKDEAANERIVKRYEQLENLIFVDGGLEIRPPRDFDEIVREGKKLNHCVGGYAERYSNNQCTLMFIRNLGKPDSPFYTVELSGEQVKQVRGKSNKAPTEQVKLFMKKFEETKLKKPKKARKQA